MRRRHFAMLLGGSILVWPRAGGSQQRASPVTGFLSSSSVADQRPFAAAFLNGLEEIGFVADRNVRIEYRWAHGQYDRLPALAADLVRVPVAVLFASGVTAALAAKASTTTVPIVFHTGGDPVQSGLVASLGKPGGNVTGVVSLNKILVPKQLELLHELTRATVIAFLVNPNNGVVRSDTSNMREAAQNKGVELRIVEARNTTEIDTAFTSLAQHRTRALIVQVDPFFDSQRERLAGLATRYAVPALGAYPEFAAAGGLISYGNSLTGAYRLAGNYAGRILKGERPAELPVQQSVKAELVINVKTAKALGITVPPSLMVRADQILQ
jgi:putative ABC transport system substrate-binding protein